MIAVRKLTLKKEVLVQLTSGELGSVVGAAATRLCVTQPCITPYSALECLPTNGCG